MQPMSKQHNKNPNLILAVITPHKVSTIGDMCESDQNEDTFPFYLDELENYFTENRHK